MNKVIGRPRYIIPHAQDNGPTPERAAKGVFTGGRPAREKTVVDAMLSAGDISQDQADAADRWLRTWIFAYDGYKEFSDNHQPNTEIKHDDLSWLMTRGDAIGCLYDVRQAIGACGELRLKGMLLEKLSFSAMGRTLFPRISPDLSRKKVSAQCALVLEQLYEFYQNERLAKKSKKETCTPVPFRIG
ncbi:hypothetical protein [Acetobacter pasteurianus]|uniref:Uncharacterized protein n=1 Tax=Acetobacter pasteurianus subsp. pasteurianus TaxID=481145 RepID=A0AAC9SS89_ACEPA|nr:hypothetical protein [Acetobacter pasteurianus]ASC05222.1 hypothetical protein S101468_00955 [Acetobacter pasteurianus subsp. pasteurianus]